MMDALDVLAEAQKRGLRLELRGHDVAIAGPKANLTEALVGAVKAFKREIVELLRPKPAVNPSAHLLPFAEKRVKTPKGAGWLRNLVGGAWVTLDGQDKMTQFDFAEVHYIPGEQT